MSKFTPITAIEFNASASQIAGKRDAYVSHVNGLIHQAVYHHAYHRAHDFPNTLMENMPARDRDHMKQYLTEFGPFLRTVNSKDKDQTKTFLIRKKSKDDPILETHEEKVKYALFCIEALPCFDNWKKVSAPKDAPLPLDFDDSIARYIKRVESYKGGILPADSIKLQALNTFLPFIQTGICFSTLQDDHQSAIDTLTLQLTELSLEAESLKSQLAKRPASKATPKKRATAKLAA